MNNDGVPPAVPGGEGQQNHVIFLDPENPVVQVLHRIGLGLQTLETGMARVINGANQIRDEPTVMMGVAVNRPVTRLAITQSINLVEQSVVRVQACRNIITFMHIANPELLAFPEQLATIAVATRMINSLAMAVHSILVYNSDARLDRIGYYNVQEGLSHIHTALSTFHDVVRRLRLLMVQPGGNDGGDDGNVEQEGVGVDDLGAGGNDGQGLGLEDHGNDGADVQGLGLEDHGNDGADVQGLGLDNLDNGGDDLEEDADIDEADIQD